MSNCKSTDEFDKKYTGDVEYNWDDQEGQEGQMETYFPHIGRVLDLANSKDPKDYRRVWTVVDGSDSDDLFIVAGYHLVNRVMYFISNEMWGEEDECYYWFESDES